MVTTKRFIMQISEHSHARVKEVAAREHLSMTAFVTRLTMARVDEVLGQQTVEIRKDIPVQKQPVVDTSSSAFDNILARRTKMAPAKPVEAEPEPEDRSNWTHAYYRDPKTRKQVHYYGPESGVPEFPDEESEQDDSWG